MHKLASKSGPVMPPLPPENIWRHSAVQNYSPSLWTFTALSTERLWLRPAQCQKGLTLGNASGHMGHDSPVRRGGFWSGASLIDNIDRSVPALWHTPPCLRAACSSHMQRVALPSSKIAAMYLFLRMWGAAPLTPLVAPATGQRVCLGATERDNRLASSAKTGLQHCWKRCSAANHPACVSHIPVTVKMAGTAAASRCARRRRRPNRAKSPSVTTSFSNGCT